MKELNKIDHTDLRVKVPMEDLKQNSFDVEKYHLNSLCVRSSLVRYVIGKCRVSSAIGFPREEVREQADLFVVGIDRKTDQIVKSMAYGVDELDILLDINKVRYDQPWNYSLIISQIDKFLSITERHRKDREVCVKIIFSIECLLEQEIEQMVMAFSTSISNFIDHNPNNKLKFVFKTSSGFLKNVGPSVFDLDKLRLLMKYLKLYDMDKNIFVKPAGRIKTREDVDNVSRICGRRLHSIGSSSGIKIVKGSV